MIQELLAKYRKNAEAEWAKGNIMAIPETVGPSGTGERPRFALPRSPKDTARWCREAAGTANWSPLFVVIYLKSQSLLFVHGRAVLPFTHKPNVCVNSTPMNFEANPKCHMQEQRAPCCSPGWDWQAKQALRQERRSLVSKKWNVCQQWGCALVSADCSALAKAQPAAPWDRTCSHHCQSCTSSSLLIFQTLDTEEILINRRETKEKHQKGGGACEAWGTAGEAGLLQPQQGKDTGAAFQSVKGNTDAGRLSQTCNETTRAHSPKLQRDPFWFKREKGKLSDQGLEGVNQRAWKASILVNFKHLTVQCPKQSEKASRSATLSRMLDPMIPRGPLQAKLIAIFQ